MMSSVAQSPLAPAQSRPVRSAAAILLTGGIAAVVTLACWAVLHQLTLPAFGGSLMTRALATASTVGVLVVVIAALAVRSNAQLRGVARSRWFAALTTALAYLCPAGLVVATLGIPLSTTRLYLDGISVDQEFRTEYLTRMAADFGLHDMAYIDVPTFYPAGWFFVGGRLANLLGIPGWEVFQPWALMTLAATGAMLVPLWRHLTGSLPLATGIALATTAVALSAGAEEPYAAAVAMGLPAYAVLVRRGLRGGRWSLVGSVAYLGVSATMYTLYTGVAALSAIVLAVAAAWSARSVRPLVRLVVLGVGSILIALSVWGPYVWARLTGQPNSGATATHYLPNNGAVVPLPMLAGSIIGFVCLVGVVWLVARFAGARTSDTARALGAVTVVLYVWVVASMVATLGGGTLLGFRLAGPIALLLVTAGVFGVVDAARCAASQVRDTDDGQVARRVGAAVAVLLLIAGVAYAQGIPHRLHGPLDLAHTDTDGYGERADRFAPDSGYYYGEIHQVLMDAGLEPAETVVLTDERNFQAFFPWYSFQALTSHYANPLGEFDKRNAAIEQWSQITQPDELVAALDATDWRGPDVLILRGQYSDEDSPLTLDIADDIYPNNPNVLFRGLIFQRSAFAEHWDIHEVGPFTVLVRQ
ncbi:galactan 5-O-arabinofuranosyltransferase [Corynebacterium sp. TAE3-ERU12]|uniref:galactan 5-O-arabinofuranosyltransferase n=1 Tax=Corynebacterium sp. TAE3-ERU12 TaxID=2849491 RepID=UPI001C44213A|nr:galactan 5-O-arabinofuranosyltransferase [Corynebacterium sp. TAE3-ERU12]MBV7294410.1 galactan 5-O-arabinofuranosyltransferase [Corynebacterium sp. TAE3-ERU12]